MIFIESSLFSKARSGYLSDDEYREMQTFLMLRPEAGDVIQSTGGLRKLRWSAKGKGKRGGIRVIYYFYVARDRFYLLTLYAKNEMSDLSDSERKLLSQLMEQWRDEQT
jgi:hypothetical protein